MRSTIFLKTGYTIGFDVVKSNSNEFYTCDIVIKDSKGRVIDEITILGDDDVITGIKLNNPFLKNAKK